jgi:predicted MFS family arabinose efflux permease
MTSAEAVRARSAGPRQAAPALFALGVAGFLAVTTEMLPVGLLPRIGEAFSISESLSGLLVGLYAVMVALLAVPLTSLTQRLPRKPLLLATLVGYAVSNATVALAPVFAVVAVGRTLGGITHALFFSLLIGYAPRLVSSSHLGRALALVSGGTTAGLVLGAPLSTSLGTAFGWRTPFVVLAAASILTCLLVARLLPEVAREDEEFRPQRSGRGALAAVSASNAVAFLGQFSLYTFISVLFLSSGFSHVLIGPLLLICGMCGLAGLWYVGRNLDRRPRRTAVVVFAACIAAIVAVGLAWPAGVVVVAAAAVWNAAFGGVPTLFQAGSVRTRAVSPEMAGAWTNATANAGIAGGAALGSGVLGIAGVSALPWVSVALFFAALVLVWLSRSAFPVRGDGGIS